MWVDFMRVAISAPPHWADPRPPATWQRVAADRLYIDLLAHAATSAPSEPLEARVMKLLESLPGTESLDDPAFSKINGHGTKADYLLSERLLVAELKTLNGDPHDRIEQRLRTRLQQSDAPIVFGTVGVGRVTEGLHDREAVDKMMADLAGRAVRRHLQKANAQLGAIKERIPLPDAGGLLVLMNDSEPMIDASAIGYALKTAFEATPGAYEHVTHVWAMVESHRIAMSGGRAGFPHLHVFRSLARQADLEFIAELQSAWATAHGSRIERIVHGGDWNSMAAIHDGEAPTLSPF
jgi:hypothetical protein